MAPKCNFPILPKYMYSFSDLCAQSSTYGMRHLGFSLNAFVVKVIVVGITGLIGSELLDEIIRNGSITSIVVLSRTPLWDVEGRDSRIKVLVVEDFGEYGEQVVKEMEGAKAVFWMMGESSSEQTASEKRKEVEIQYPLALARALITSKQAATLSEKREMKLRFLLISGQASERDQSQRLESWDEKGDDEGEVQDELFGLAAQNEGFFEAVGIRYENILPRETEIPDLVTGVSRNAIRVDELGAAMVHCALDGHGNETLENTELRNIGRKILKTGEVRK